MLGWGIQGRKNFSMARNHVGVVHKKLQGYADRGVFRSFDVGDTKGSKTVFRFIWLEDTPFTLVFDHDKGILQLKNLLPNVESRSFLDNALREYIGDRANPTLPAHRRVDPKRATLRYSNRKEHVSLTLAVEKNQYSYAVTKLLNVTNELFGHLHMYHIQYLWDNFEVPQE